MYSWNINICYDVKLKEEEYNVNIICFVEY